MIWIIVAVLAMAIMGLIMVRRNRIDIPRTRVVKDNYSDLINDTVDLAGDTESAPELPGIPETLPTQDAGKMRIYKKKTHSKLAPPEVKLAKNNRIDDLV